MRAVHIVALLLLVATPLTGCLEVPDGKPEPGEESDRFDQSDSSQDGQTGSSDPSAGDDKEGRNDTDGEGNASSDASNGEADDGRVAAPPPLQQQDHPEDVVRNAQFAFLPKRENATDARWELPSWEVGYWWDFEYRHEEYHSLCDETGQNPDLPEQRWRQEVKDEAEVNGTQPDWSVPVFTMELTQFCADEPPGSFEINRSQDHLTRIHSSPPHRERHHGHIEHETLFPLEDGKRWVFMGDNHRLKEAEVTHRPDFNFSGESVEAWEVTITWEQVGKRTLRTYFGVEVGWILRQEESWRNTVLELVDHHGDGLL